MLSSLSQQIQKRYQIEFKKPDLLEQAFTHSSYVNEHRHLGLQDNERLEFLGDRAFRFSDFRIFISTIPSNAGRKINENASGNCLRR